ncbi:MAG: HlyD family efflux transporter periplasmic adaptor subunit [Symploca sp. SIO1C2]|nr:HlyD family efflux transporter periplasmic adaptor subunit [Symploca sp. SIO1C2]
MPDAKLESPNPQFIRAAHPDEFLPPLGKWTIIGGLVMLAGLVGAIALSAVLKYKVVVKAPVTVRPAGELRLVEAQAEGSIKQIEVKVNQSVQAGDVIAFIDDTNLQSQKRQLLNKIDSAQQQLRQLQAQQQWIDRQLAAETEQLQRIISSAEADLRLNQRAYQDSLTVSKADIQEAEAALALAEDELTRYQKLADTGAVSELQVQEKVAAVVVSKARLTKVKAALNPSDAQVVMAKERIAQEQARGEATIARLTQEREEQLRQYQEFNSQLVSDRQDLESVEHELKYTKIRAPISGIILELKLRNFAQVVQRGDEIAQIAPATEDITLKAMVASQDINQVEIGQSVDVRISACPYPDFGILPGVVKAASPDAVNSETITRPSFPNASSSPSRRSYEVIIQPTQLMLATNQRQCLIQPGMEGQAEIISRQETVLQFFLRKARLQANL